MSRVVVGGPPGTPIFDMHAPQNGAVRTRRGSSCVLSATRVPGSQQRQGAVAPDHQHAAFIWGVSAHPRVGDDTGHVGAGQLDGPLRALGAGNKLQTAAETQSALHVKRPLRALSRETSI